MITFKIAVNDPSQSHFLLDKAGADNSHNQIVLNAIVGTLVKYGTSGRIEPYLAESWTVSEDKKIWKFKIRNNLQCEDGTIITAELFKNILEENLKEYSKDGSVIMFDHLYGWDDFKNGISPSIDGLKSYRDTIEFKFNDNPDDLLELLRMPFFGLWKEKNHQLISSGPYTFKKIDDGKVILSLRNNWFTVKNDSIKEVEISFSGFSKADKVISPNTIIRFPFYVEPDEAQKNSYWIKSPPTFLETFVLSPSKNNFFSHLNNRQIFKNRVLSLYPNLVKSKFFYPAARSENLICSDLEYKKTNEKIEKLTFAVERSTYSKEEFEKLNQIITFALKGSHAQYEIVSRDLKDKKWFSKAHSNNLFDARIATVDIGAYPDYLVVKMMFCSNLGIKFPDPSGRICSLISGGIQEAAPVDKFFVDQFNKILNEDSVVVPIIHHADKWLVADNFDPTSLPPTTIYPQFELIKLR